MPKLVIDDGKMNFTDFSQAVKELTEEYGYQGADWDLVVESQDFDELFDFLNDAGISAVLSS